jgi:hypothetical protein
MGTGNYDPHTLLSGSHRYAVNVRSPHHEGDHDAKVPPEPYLAPI